MRTIGIFMFVCLDTNVETISICLGKKKLMLVNVC
jgi:hypothetical protein